MGIEIWSYAKHFDAARSLLAARTQRPYRRYGRLAGEDRITALAERHASRLLASDRTMALAFVEDSHVTAIAAGSILEWDSRQFGVTAARLDLFCAAGSYRSSRERQQKILSAFLEEGRGRGVVHLTARTESDDLAAIHTLESSGFELLDGVQTLAIQLESRPSEGLAHDFHVRLSRPEDEDQIAAIARTAYSLDRFHADAMLSEAQADALHEEWMRNSCRGLAADAVIVAVRDKRVLGYVTCRIDRETPGALGVSFGAIVLVATERESRGQGIARQTTRRALQWFWDENVRVVEVGTQLRNIGAGRVYEHAGFRLMNVSLTLRKDLRVADRAGHQQSVSDL